MPNQKEVLEYARRIKRERPDTSKEEMRDLLEAKYLHEQDVFDIAAAHGTTFGAINNPMDWLKGLGKIFEGLGKLLGDDTDPEGVKDIIDGVVEILY